jgi:hypothetical protein
LIIISTTGQKMKKLSSIRQIKAVVLEDGEVIEVEDDREVIPMESAGKGEYVRLFQVALKAFAQRTYHLDVLRVWLWLIANTGFGNQLRVTQKEIGLSLGIDQPRVAKAMRILRCNNQVERREKGVLVLDSHEVWKGDYSSLMQERWRARQRKVSESKSAKQEQRHAG